MILTENKALIIKLRNLNTYNSNSGLISDLLWFGSLTLVYLANSLVFLR